VPPAADRVRHELDPAAVRTSRAARPAGGANQRAVMAEAEEVRERERPGVGRVCMGIAAWT
jgi:hypothetical protein